MIFWCILKKGGRISVTEKIWNVRATHPEQTKEFVRTLHLPLLTAGVLSARGYDTESARQILSPDETRLHDPMLLKDMDRAAAAVQAAVENGDMICVFGDYDCDGVAATAIVYDYLTQIGARVCYYIPDREKEGYGLNKKAIDSLKQYGVDLILTVDNGVSAIEEIAYAAELGVSVVVTDHHSPREILPDALAVVDPHRKDCAYPFPEICGAGVAFKLLCALEGETGYGLLEEYGDLLTIGTVADVVALQDENRVFVRRGLELLRTTHRPGLAALLRLAGLEEKVLSADSVAFGIAPRINAAGRIGSAETAVMLLLTESESEGESLAEELDACNRTRREEESRVLDGVARQLAENPSLTGGRLIVFDGEGWNPGVVGIVCSRMVERFQKPCLIIAREGEHAKGSGRSVPGFSLIEAVSACAPLLTRYGGHPMAAGFSLASSDIPAFRAALEEYAAASCPEMPLPTLLVDLVVPPSLLTVEQVEGLSLLEPFGCGNEPPVFAVRGARLDRVIPLSDGKHCKLRLSKDGVSFFLLCFSVRPEELGFSGGDTVDAAFSASINEYMGEKSVSLRMQSLSLSSDDPEALCRARQRYESCLRGECGGAALLPTREETAQVYRFLRGAGTVPFDMDALYRRMCRGRVTDYVHFRLSVDILTELGVLIREGQTLSVAPAGAKVDLSSSEIVRRLSAYG